MEWYDDYDEESCSNYYEDNGSGYSQADLDDMYRAAFEGDPEAEWNID